MTTKHNFNRLNGTDLIYANTRRDGGHLTPMPHSSVVISQAPQVEALFSLEDLQSGRRQASWPEWQNPDLSEEELGLRQLRTVGLLQFAPQRRSPTENAAFIYEKLRYVRSATIVLPEYFLGAYSTAPEGYSELDVRGLLNNIIELTQANDLAVIGSLPVVTPVGVQNAVTTVVSGTVNWWRQSKVNLFGAERQAIVPGNSADVQGINGLRSVVQICMDIVDPLPTRQAVSYGARAILSPSTVSVDYLSKIHRARALENQVISVFCNRCGSSSDGIRYLGRSAIFFPDGTEVTLDAHDERLLTVDVDFGRVAGYKDAFGQS